MLIAKDINFDGLFFSTLSIFLFHFEVVESAIETDHPVSPRKGREITSAAMVTQRRRHLLLRHPWHPYETFMSGMFPQGFFFLLPLFSSISVPHLPLLFNFFGRLFTLFI